MNKTNYLDRFVDKKVSIDGDRYYLLSYDEEHLLCHSLDREIIKGNMVESKINNEVLISRRFVKKITEAREWLK